MTAIEQQKLGKALWGIADKLRGAMNADDFRDYMNLSKALFKDCFRKSILVRRN